MNTTERWERLADNLREAGFPVRVARQRIEFRTPKGTQVTVRDTWWSKNPDKWTGYQVELAGKDDITLKVWPRTTKRSEVVAAVQQAVSL